MRNNFMTRDQEAIDMTMGAYGSSRMAYNAISLSLAGNTKEYNAGKLEEKAHTHVTYDLAQKFPSQQLAEVLKPTQTDLRQIHAAPNEFTYVQFAKGVEFQMSNMSGVESGSIVPSALREMTKEWDHLVMMGGAGNEGFLAHSRAAQIAGGALSFAALTAKVSEAVTAIKGLIDVTSDNLTGITTAYSGEVASVLDVFEAGSELTNRQKFEAQFPGLRLLEIPSNIVKPTDPAKVLVVATGLVTLHRASMPAVYASEAGKYGLSQDTMFTYESAGVELEEDGAIQEITFS